MMRIRLFERQVQDLFRHAKLPGFVHLSIGQEAVAVGACSCLSEGDRIVSTHRGHGHIIAKGGDPNAMTAELLGRRDGYCKGKGGSMHIADFAIGMLGANGIVGAGIPIATGSALAERVRGSDRVTVCFFGDGAVGEGVLSEALNLSALWSLPVIFLCEANGWSEWTPTSEITVGEISDRAAPFGIPGVKVDGNDVLAVRAEVETAVHRARSGLGPTLIEAETYRILAHNEGEEAFTGEYRDANETAKWSKLDPIDRLRRHLDVVLGVAPEELDDIDRREEELIQSALAFAERSPEPSPGEVLDDLYA